MVVHIVLNNGMLDFVNIEQEEAGFVPFGTDFLNPDFGRVAEVLGATGIRIEEPGDVREGLYEALAHKDGPVVVDVLVDRFALSRPAHVPAETVKGFTLSLAEKVADRQQHDRKEHQAQPLATPVRVPEKMNTRITRAKRHYLVNGGATAAITMQAR